MNIQEQIEHTGRTIRTLATRRQDARERGDVDTAAALGVEYRAALDAMNDLINRQYRERTAIKRRRDPMHGITKG